MRDRERQLELTEKLRPVGEDAFLEAGFLLDYLSMHPDADADQLIRRRLSGEPLQYVLGEWDFWGMTFTVDRRALIPRPDTELLTETALELLHGGERVLDLCCGSGCIGISIAASIPIELVSADISPDALSLTRENAERHGIRLSAVESDLFENVSGTFDLIACNPPYLTGEEMRCRDQSLRFEPAVALDGGKDGLDFYRRIREKYPDYLMPDGTLLLEIGYQQSEQVLELFPGASILNDYGGRSRCVVIRNND